MRRAIFVAVLCLLYVSLHAQLFPDLITFNALKDGVYDVAVIKKELIINGFTKITKDSESLLDVDNYAYGYDEDGETASIWVEVGTLIESEDGGFYVISVQTFGQYIHDELVDDINENCKFCFLHLKTIPLFHFKSIPL